jgi:hypothetical protein
MATGGTFFVNTANSVSGDGATNKTDGSTDSAYVSLSQAEADLQGVLVDDLIIYCSGGADSASVSITGWTTSASARLIIQGLPAAHAQSTGDGKNDTKAFSTSYYYQNKTTNNVRQVWVQEDFVVIDGIQFRYGSTGGQQCIEWYFITATNKAQLLNCKFHRDVAVFNCRAVYLNDADIDIDIWCNLFNWTRAGEQYGDKVMQAYRSGITASIYNNTIGTDDTQTDTDDPGGVFIVAGVSAVIHNNAIFCGGGDEIRSFAASTITHNATTAGEGTSPQTNPADLNDMLTDWEGLDWSPVTGSILIGNGTTGGPTHDQNGVEFTTQDIGCFAFPSAGGGGTILPQMMMMGVG